MDTQTASHSLAAKVAALGDAARLLVSAPELRDEVAALDDAALEAFVTAASELGQAAELLRTIGIGVIGARSTRAAGHSGFVQARGHRNTAAFVQHLTGSTRGEAARLVRVGEAMLDAGSPEPGGLPGMPAGDGSGGDSGAGDSGAADAVPVMRLPWHAPLGEALMRGQISAAQHDAIRGGLGEPPLLDSADLRAATDGPCSCEHRTDEHRPDERRTDEHCTCEEHGDGPVAAVESWRLAAEQLLEEAGDVTVEDLGKHARAIRDLLDPEGAHARYLARHERRSFKLWTDSEGLTHGKFIFDDESAAWVRTVIDTALKPRRGGPRFVHPDEQQAAKALVEDPRTNEQLAHDLLLDVLKAGTVADAVTVLGARQAGVRIVQHVDRDTYLAELAAPTITRFEDDAAILPAAAAEQQQCNSGIVPVIADREGNPLDLGRETRLYTAKQRIALASRDGGCVWPGCDRPSSYCEAHHIDAWTAENGRTDIDRGILLCRFHHMQLHHGKWRITRNGIGPFKLHPPGEEPPIELRPPAPLRYAWQHLGPPPKRFKPAA